MRTLPSLLLALALAASLPAQAADPANGAKLVQASQCGKCHGTEIYTRPDRKVKSLAGLEKQVRMCDQNLGLTWFDEDILDVAAYLNQAYYHFH